MKRQRAERKKGSAEDNKIRGEEILQMWNRQEKRLKKPNLQ